MTETEALTGMLYQGQWGYVWLKRIEHAGKTGALLYYNHPDPRKLHIIDEQGMKELYHGIRALADAAQADHSLSFCVFFGAYDLIHAGADITQFAGDCDYDSISSHLYRGADLDVQVKQLWPRLRTVSVYCGDRFGGSLEWPLFAQWGVADGRTRVQFSEVHLGIIPGWNGVLNAILRTHPANARYMAQTGNPISADQMLRMGLVQAVVQTPPAPDKRITPAEEWPTVWAAHAEICQRLLLEEALSLATQPDEPRRETSYRLSTDEELGEEVRRRTDVARYKALRARFRQDLARIDKDSDKSADAMKQLARELNSELGRTGKPLAPKAVAAISQYVQRWSAVPKEQLLAHYEEAAHAEVALCDELMHTEHRRIGVNAVLTRILEERIPVFE
jgi:enoyl-CoA hydratase/carnithine racemase